MSEYLKYNFYFPAKLRKVYGLLLVVSGTVCVMDVDTFSSSNNERVMDVVGLVRLV